MKRKFIYQLTASVVAIASLFVASSCDDDENTEGAAPTISLSQTSTTNKAGAVVSVTASITAPNGGKVLQFSGVDNDDITLNGGKTQDVEVEFTIPANAAAGSEIVVVFTAVDKADKISAPVEYTISVGEPYEVLQGEITANTTLNAANRYLIRGKVYVVAPATLTIPAGTIIFGEKSTDGTLIISRGAKIDAKGTAANPIIMTSQAAKGFRNRGDWGGLVILGKAYNSNGASAAIEGIQGEANSEKGVYGPGAGDAIENDNSGFLQYVRIEYAGIALSQDNELNCLTMGSVGSASTIDHIMVSYANDDAFEWFGGSVSHKYLVAFSTLDDDFDTDRGYNGKVQFGAVLRDPLEADFSGSRAWESSSNNNATAPSVGGISRHSSPKFSHITVWGPLLFRSSAQINAFYRAAVEVNSNSAIEIHNSIITGFTNSANFATAGSKIMHNVFAANTTQAASGAQAPANFATDNTLATDVTAIFGAYPSGSVYSFATPPVFQAAASPYLTGATDLSADTFFENAAHYGAFGTTAATGWGFDAGWINFAPNNADY